VKFFLSFNLPTYQSSPPSLENSYKILILFSFLSPTPKLILPPLLKKLVATNTFKIELKLFFFGGKRIPSQDPSPSFKERVKLFCLVANGRRRRRLLAWWSMEGEGEGYWLGGQWKIPCLVTIGMFHACWPLECEGKKHPFTSSIFL
jgi:hypothetical protein